MPERHDDVPPGAGGSVTLKRATPDIVHWVWNQRWGDFMVSPYGEYHPPDVEGLAAVDARGTVAGLVTWSVEKSTDDGKVQAVLVSLDTMVPGRGIGRLLLSRAEQVLRERGVLRTQVFTTNDNLAALAFYLKRGYRLFKVHLHAMDRVRALKPHLELTGAGGLPLMDMWELNKELK